VAVARSKSAYTTHLAAHLPQGDAWPREGGSWLMRLLGWMAGEFARIDARVADVLREADPRTTVEMLADWEDECGLPDACSGLAETLEARRAAVIQRLTSTGGASRGYFIALAATLGYPGATVTEFKPFTTGSACTDAVNGAGWLWTWRLNLPTSTRIWNFTAQSACNEPLRSWGDGALECIVGRLKPAHTHVIFGYPAEV
jgi:uncharacterized protein YmfQ (DUF2313 family)